MTLLDIVLLESIFFCLMFIILFICIIIIKNSNKLKQIKRLESIYLILFIILIMIIPFVLNLEIGLGAYLLIALLGICIFIFILSSIIFNIKIKKYNDNTTQKKSYKLLIVMTIIPILVYLIAICREIYFINNNDLLLICTDYRGGFTGDITEIYSVDGKSFYKISIGAVNRAEKIENFIFNRTKELRILDYDITNQRDIVESTLYSIEGSKYYLKEIYDNNIVLIYKDKDCIYELKDYYSFAVKAIKINTIN